MTGVIINDADDYLAQFQGEMIGKGASRRVYEHAAEPGWVIKVEEIDGGFYNAMEWKVWEYAQFMPQVRGWLAPCCFISRCGRLLVQCRTEPVFSDELPDKVPSFFTDLKASNWGRYDGHVVCHDYASHLLWNGLATTRRKRAKWDYAGMPYPPTTTNFCPTVSPIQT